MLNILSRLLAASVGGYALANIAAILLSSVLPIPRPDAVLTAILLSFAFYTGAILWAVSARTARHAWIGLLLPSAIFACLVWLTKPAGAL